MGIRQSRDEVRAKTLKFSDGSFFRIEKMLYISSIKLDWSGNCIRSCNFIKKGAEAPFFKKFNCLFFNFNLSCRFLSSDCPYAYQYK